MADGANRFRSSHRPGGSRSGYAPEHHDMPVSGESRTRRTGTPPRRSAPAVAGAPLERRDPAPSARSHRTALRSSRPLGSAEITHPFHPLRGQRFVVLKVRTVSGVETLSLRQAELGSFAVAREWTDWAPPGAQAVPSDGKALLIDASGLLALDQLVASLTRTVKLDQ